MIETARQLFVVKEGRQPSSAEEVERWFLGSQWAAMTYAALIEECLPSLGDQNSFLSKRLSGRPGAAHSLLAELARRDLVRAFVTTNFDLCIEEALREAGVSSEVVASLDDLRGMLPLVHSNAVRVYKPHGTLGRGALLNTPTDLKTLPREMEDELSRLFGEHAVLIIGYAGRDPGLMKALANRRKGLFSVYWSEPNHLDESVERWIRAERYDLLQSLRAADFLGRYLQALDQVNLAAQRGSISASRFAAALNAGTPWEGELAKFLSSLWESLVNKTRANRTEKDPDEVIGYVARCQPEVLEFAVACRQSATFGTEKALESIWDGLGDLIGLAEDRQSNGVPDKSAREGFELLSYQLLLVFVGVQIVAERWESIGRLWRSVVFVREGPRSRYLRAIDLNYRGSLLEDSAQRSRSSVIHGVASILKEFFESKTLSREIGLKLAWEADYLMYLCSAINQPNFNASNAWKPHLAAGGVLTTPRFLLQAQSKAFFEGNLRSALGLPLTAPSQVARQLKNRLWDFQAYWPTQDLGFDFDPEKIGTV